MTTFLLLFSRFRDLLASEISLKARLETYESRVSELEAELRRVNDEHKEDLRKVTDSYSRNTGRNVFSRAEAPAAAPVAFPQPKRVMAREWAIAATREAREQYLKNVQAGFAAEAAEATAPTEEATA